MRATESHSSPFSTHINKSSTTSSVFNDSSVICQYLEDTHPQPSLYPADPADRARARWREEYAETALADALIWRLFYQ